MKPGHTRAARSAWPNCRSGFRWKSRRKWRFDSENGRAFRSSRRQPSGFLEDDLRERKFLLQESRVMHVGDVLHLAVLGRKFRMREGGVIEVAVPARFAG